MPIPRRIVEQGRARVVILTVFALTVIPCLCSAAPGVNLAWDNCFNGTSPPGAAYKTFACNTNSGNAKLFSSVVAPSGIDQWVSFEWYFQLQSAAATLPQWWQIRGAGAGCNRSALTSAAAGVFDGCTDAYQGNAGGGIGQYAIGYNGLNRARLLGVYAVPGEFAAALNPDEEYFVTQLQISYIKTAGTGSCAGCQNPVCIVTESVNVVQPAGAPGGDVKVTAPAVRLHVTWQSPVISFPCVGEVPTRQSTWSRVKSLYR